MMMKTMMRNYYPYTDNFIPFPLGNFFTILTFLIGINGLRGNDAYRWYIDSDDERVYGLTAQ